MPPPPDERRAAVRALVVEEQGDPLRTDEIVALVLSRAREIGHDEIEDSLARIADLDLAGWQVWLVPGRGRGFAGLVLRARERFSIRFPEALEAIAATCFDVDARIARRPARLTRWRTRNSGAMPGPDFSRGHAPMRADNVTTFHWWQVSQRVLGRWRTPADPALLADDDPIEELAAWEGAAPPESAACHSEALWVAAAWAVMLAAREDDARSEALQQLYYGFGWIELPGWDPRGARRNEPGRVRARFDACFWCALGLQPWIAGALRGGGRPASVGGGAAADWEAARGWVGRWEAVFPKVSAALGESGWEPERAAVVRVLREGSHVHNQLAHIQGASPPERRERLSELATAVGQTAAAILMGGGGGGGGSGGGPPCGHGSERTRLRAIAGGSPLNAATDSWVGPLLASCEPCREWFAAVCEAVSLPATSLPVTEEGIVVPMRAPTRWKVWVMTGAIAALALLVPLASGPDRGVRGPAAGSLLTLTAWHDGGPRADGAAALHERMKFTATATPDATVYLWITLPDDTREALGSMAASPAAAELPTAWRFDVPGPHVFTLTTDVTGACGETGCARLTVEVGP